MAVLGSCTYLLCKLWGLLVAEAYGLFALNAQNGIIAGIIPRTPEMGKHRKHLGLDLGSDCPIEIRGFQVSETELFIESYMRSNISCFHFTTNFLCIPLTIFLPVQVTLTLGLKTIWNLKYCAVSTDNIESGAFHLRKSYTYIKWIITYFGLLFSAHGVDLVFTLHKIGSFLW